MRRTAEAPHNRLSRWRGFPLMNDPPETARVVHVFQNGQIFDKSRFKRFRRQHPEALFAQEKPAESLVTASPSWRGGAQQKRLTPITSDPPQQLDSTSDRHLDPEHDTPEAWWEAAKTVPAGIMQAAVKGDRHA